MSEVSSQTLHLVARELTSELNEARIALEAFGEQQEDVGLLNKCREHLHQVRGALRVVEVYGAALLAEEMEQLTRYLIDNFAEKRHLSEGLDALMRAMVQLPTYLERVLSGGRDMALVLLPLLNDLRAVRGNALLSEGTLLLLNLSSDKQASPVPAAPGEQPMSVSSWARKMRARFQLGLLGWIKGERVDQNLEVLARAAEKLEQVATTQPVFQLWWVVGAIIEAMRERGLEGSASIKRLLGQADREMRRLYEQGEQRYNERPPFELLNNLLYYVARATTSGPRVAAVRASFRLGELLPVDEGVEAARESLSAPSIKLMKTVAAAIKEDLGRVKDALDIFVRKGGTEITELGPQLELLKKIGETLGVLGLGTLREKVQQEIADLQQMLAGQNPADDGMLLRVAGTLIHIEDGLDEQLVGLIMPTPAEPGAQAQPEGENDIEFRQVTEAVLRECIVNLARIKEAIALAVERPKEAQALDQVPQLIRGITAGLLMLGKSRAVEVTEGISRALARYAPAPGTVIPPERMERLADAIVAVEYYMETLQAGRSDPWYMLDNAEVCLKVLADMSTGATGVMPVLDVGEPQQTVAIELSPQSSHDVERTEVLPGAAARAAEKARLETTATQTALPPVLAPSADKNDPEFLELFIEEARDEITKLQKMFPLWEENPQDAEALTNVRRSFHTLKGSGRMVGAQLIGDFSWSIENLLNRVISKTLDRTPDILNLMRSAVIAIPELVEQLESGRTPASDIAKIIAQAHAIAGTPPRPSRPAETPAAPAPVQVAPPRAQEAKPPAMDPVLHDIFAKETAGHLAVIRDYIAANQGALAPYTVTEALHRSCHTLSGTAKTAGARQGIKIAEPLNHYIRKLYDNGAGLPEEGMRVLKDSVAAIENIVANINESTTFFAAQAEIVERLRRLEAQLDGELSSLNRAQDASAIMPMPSLREMREAANAAEEPAEPQRARSLDETVYVQGSVPVVEITLGDEGLVETQTAVPEQKPAPVETPFEEEPVEIELDLQPDGTFVLATPQHAMLEAPLEDPSDTIVRQTAKKAADELVVETAAWAADFRPLSLSDQEPPTLQHDDDAGTLVNEVMPEAFVAEEAPQIEVEEITYEPEPEQAVEETVPPRAPAVAEPTYVPPAENEDNAVDEDFDADVAAIFTEEAAELLEAADVSLSSWSQDPSNQAAAFELKRVVHTLKGGARMAGIRAMGDLSHELETLVQQMELGTVSANEQIFAALQASLDELHHMREAVNQGHRVRAARDLINRLRVLGGHAPLEDEPVAALAPESAPVADVTAPAYEDKAVPEVSEAVVDVAQEGPAQFTVPTLEADHEVPGIEVAYLAQPAGFAETSQPAEAPELPVEAAIEAQVPVLPPGREPQKEERGEVARVDADLLDTLLNNAGEVSIFRSRLEQQVTSIEFNLQELGRTVTRLKEQLRKLELETEAQVLHKHQDEAKGHEDFDPLELDRYSTIQQLSRALAESVADVGSIEGLLENQSREAQNLLLQQSRVVTELQNGLMRTRMVPFSRHVQRLTRIVRQVATDTQKKAELVVSGASGELDRQVLERMLPPFEHMLRNSVVHGIETPEERRTAGKPETGTIKVDLHREGAEMVVVVEDDGRGIDVKAVRERARAKGLLQPGRILTDEEALQLVLEPGFSTASSITQHAGRGVGMDVVVTEIKKLGGALFTQSTPGQGVRFTVRLPFTLAISQALIVRVDEEMYALPLPTVEGVARLSREEVAKHLAEETPSFNYGGQIYRFQHLGTFIGAGPSILPTDNDVAVPVVLIRAGEHSTALVTDELVGNREIVVKSVGPQVAGIRGIAGATILGDGRVVIILDMGALVRSEWRARPVGESVTREDRRTFALVVDDSITVRRVTQRLLERNGMRVLTAKDGVDALSILQEHLPDIILLDIEMPRMDGYELAAQVRSDPRLAHTPIVMITSRVGEKHRARAIELGVNDYLGKPYQENQLLDAIEPLVNKRRKALASL